MSIKSQMGFLFLTAVYAVDVMGMKELQLLSCTLSICALFCTCALLRLDLFLKRGSGHAVPSNISLLFPPGLPLFLFPPGPKKHTQQLTWAVPPFTTWDREGRRVGHSGFGFPGTWWPGSGEDSGCTFP